MDRETRAQLLAEPAGSTLPKMSSPSVARSVRTGGDIGMWQGVCATPTTRCGLRWQRRSTPGEGVTVELLYSDQIGQQRTITRFADADGRLVAVQRDETLAPDWDGPRPERSPGRGESRAPRSRSPSSRRLRDANRRLSPTATALVIRAPRRTGSSPLRPPRWRARPVYKRVHTERRARVSASPNTRSRKRGWQRCGRGQAHHEAR